MISFVDNDIDGSLISQLADIDSKFYKQGLLKISEEERENLVKIQIKYNNMNLYIYVIKYDQFII